MTSIIPTKSSKLELPIEVRIIRAN